MTIFASYLGKFYPFLHVFLSNKSQNLYSEVFIHIRGMITKVPKIIVIDFERALLNSLDFIFHDSSLRGCNFHFGQMIWRKIQSLGMSMKYSTNTWERSVLRKCFVLAFFPIEYIHESFLLIQDEILEREYDFQMDSFLKYFQKKFIGFPDENIEPPYSKEFWSVYRRIIEREP